MNGTVSGISPPIVLDYKTYRKKPGDLTSNVYFYFTFIVRSGVQAMWGKKEEAVCEKGYFNIFTNLLFLN